MIWIFLLVYPFSCLAFDIVSTHSHDRHNFTQGLQFIGDELIESSGRYGKSFVIQYNPISGKASYKVKVAPNYFAEGLTEFNGKYFLLTWKQRQVLVLDKSLNTMQTLVLPSAEGWGLCNQKEAMIYSDGSNKLYKVDENFKIIQVYKISWPGHQLKYLNELECIGDYVLANIWQSNQFVVIHIPQQKVVQSFDLNSLAKMAQNKASWPIDVMNGLAWNEKRRTLWITGKYWPLLFELYMPEGEWQ